MNAGLQRRLALFGGTFDPVHNGHLDLAEKARVTCQLDQVVFIPCARSPFKEKDSIASPNQRCEMLGLAIAERGWEAWAKVSRFEIGREPPSYSWQTAEQFRQADPDAELHWILGADQWKQIENWAEPEKLRQLLKFIVVNRSRTLLAEKPGWNARLLEFDHAASATAIRDGQGDESWLPDSVRDFIRRENLYR